MKLASNTYDRVRSSDRCVVVSKWGDDKICLFIVGSNMKKRRPKRRAVSVEWVHGRQIMKNFKIQRPMFKFHSRSNEKPRYACKLSYR